VAHLSNLSHASEVIDPAARRQILLTALRVGAAGPPAPVPVEEVAPRGHRHSRKRDAHAIAHHYDISNEFYRLLLGQSMTYSCAYWPDLDTTGDHTDTVTSVRSVNDDDTPPETPGLKTAQTAKFDLVASKLGLARGTRLLDIGCGWGSFALHAARNYGAQVVGVTLSEQQARYAQVRVEETGLAEHVEIRHQDYREVDDGPYDAVASIGMAEHVGQEQLREYAATLHGLLRPRAGCSTRPSRGVPGRRGNAEATPSSTATSSRTGSWSHSRR